MPVYNFMPRFAAAVESGEKKQTIRRTRKGAKVGSTAYLYTGQRTKSCRLLGKGTITDVEEIEISTDRAGVRYAMTLGGFITGKRLDIFARADGFNDGAEMVEWFRSMYGLPFEGYVHKWRLHE
jgi:hypothetical protein